VKRELVLCDVRNRAIGYRDDQSGCFWTVGEGKRWGVCVARMEIMTRKGRRCSIGNKTNADVRIRIAAY
jgi:hypothetical protein